MKHDPSDALSPPGAGPFARPLRVGWKEYLDLPEWKVRRVKVKIDTGARTSALGALSCELAEVAGRGLVARLCLALYRRHPERVTQVEAPVLRMVTVCSSTGVREQRPLIEAVVRLGPVNKRVLFTVANRSAMLIPIILGRQALAGDFVVDVSGKYLLRKK